MAEEKKIKDQRRRWWWWWLLGFIFPLAVTAALRACLPDGFDPAPVLDYSSKYLPVPERNEWNLEAAERIGEGLLAGPEDLAYDAQACALFTGCADGWIKKISLCGENPAVQNWSFTGGRPIGLALGSDGQLFVTDAYKGLLRVSREGEIEVLAEEAGGLRFGLLDGIDVSSNGMVYFTDASYKHNLQNHKLAALEARPLGRLLRYDPSTKTTTVLVDGLYFANGVAVSPKQDFVVVCESIMARCKKYYIEGEKKGLVENFIDDLPGFPDNIRCGCDGTFWIALAAGKLPTWGTFLRYPSIRKAVVIVSKFIELPEYKKKVGDLGVLAVNANGKPLSVYSNHDLPKITSGIRIGNSLYFGSIETSYLFRLDLTKLGQLAA